MPFWLKIAALRGKHVAWCWSMLLACLVFAFAPFLGAGAQTAFLLICLGTGFAVGADLVLPASLQADVIDVDTAATGEERSGLYLAVWGLATKLALALAVGIAFRCCRPPATIRARARRANSGCGRSACSTLPCRWR